MKDIEDIKSKWQALNNADPTATFDSAGADTTRRKRSQLTRLRRTFRIICVVAALCTFVIPANLLAMGLPRWFAVLTCIFFIGCMLCQLRLLLKAERLDLTSDTVAEVMRSARQIMSLRIIMKWALIPVALFIVIMIVYYVSTDIYAVIGAICGAAFGFAIGCRIDYNINRQLRSIAGELREI